MLLANAFLGLPPVVVGLGLYLALSRSGPLGALALLFTPSAMVLAQAMLAAPIITALARRAVEEPWQGYGGALRRRSDPAEVNWDAPRHREAAGHDGSLGRLRPHDLRGRHSLIVGGNIAGYPRTMTTAIVLKTTRRFWACAGPSFLLDRHSYRHERRRLCPWGRQSNCHNFATAGSPYWRTSLSQSQDLSRIDRSRFHHSVENSVLLANILPTFTNWTGITVHVLAQGTDRRLQTAARNDADLVLVHDPEAEQKFVAMGNGIIEQIAWNNFIVVGRTRTRRLRRNARMPSSVEGVAAAQRPLFAS